MIQVFTENTTHRLCLWHLFKNAISHCGRLKNDDHFKSAFHHCLQGSLNREHFEDNWKYMIEKYELEDDSWFKRLYELREKWATTLSKDAFSAGILSSQRSESTNNAISFNANKGTSLTAFFKLCDAMINHWRTNEIHKEFKNSHNQQEIKIYIGLINHAAEVHTMLSIIFPMF